MDEIKDNSTAAAGLLTLDNYCAITFPNTHSALKAEKVLQGADLLPFVIMPVPKTISSSCGLAIKLFAEGYNQAVGILGDAGVPIEGVYRIDKTSGTVKKLN